MILKYLFYFYAHYHENKFRTVKVNKKVCDCKSRVTQNKLFAQSNLNKFSIGL